MDFALHDKMHNVFIAESGLMMMLMVDAPSMLVGKLATCLHSHMHHLMKPRLADINYRLGAFELPETVVQAMEM